MLEAIHLLEEHSCVVDEQWQWLGQQCIGGNSEVEILCLCLMGEAHKIGWDTGCWG